MPMQLLLVGSLDTQSPDERRPVVRSSIDVLEVLLADGGNVSKGVDTDLAVGVVTRLARDQIDAWKLEAMYSEASNFVVR